MPNLPFGLKCAGRPELVLQDDRVNTIPALHTTETLGMVIASLLQVIRPFMHE
jgi:hypothetical protein